MKSMAKANGDERPFVLIIPLLAVLVRIVLAAVSTIVIVIVCVVVIVIVSVIVAVGVLNVVGGWVGCLLGRVSLFVGVACSPGATLYKKQGARCCGPMFVGGMHMHCRTY